MGISKTQRIEARIRAEANKARAAELRNNAIQKEAKKEAMVREKLSKHEKPRPIVDPVSAEVFRLAPKLLESIDYASAVKHMTPPFVRDPKDWCPKGKGRETLFRSLAEHLYSKYPMPPFLWSVFFEPQDLRKKLIPLIVSLASGNSFIDEVKTGGFPVPLTRKMCHEVLSSSANFRFLQAVRRVQIRTLGGDDRLWKTWNDTNPGRGIGSESDEIFWSTVLHWLVQNPMFDRGQVSPMCDYIAFRRREDRSFSMKGRSATAMFNGMQEWHGDLHRTKASAGQVFRASGYHGMEYDQSSENKTEIWRIREILTGRDLAREGQANKHCVYSYARSIEAGSCSIWSMTREDNSGNWHALTIEVRNSSHTVVQALGMFNRRATGPENNVLHRWSESNHLRVSIW